MKQGDQRKAIGYLRVSTDEQQNGPEAQRTDIERWCKANGVELAFVFEDRGVSGGAELDRRHGLLAALDALGEHKAGLLVVAKRDRLARDVVLAAMVERLAARKGARVVSANNAGNGDAPEDLLMRRLVDAFGEYERALIRARTKAALAVKRGRLERTGGVPYGWSLAGDGAHLEPAAAEQAVITAALELRGQGLVLRAVGAALEARGLLPRCGRRWNPKTVRGLLSARLAA